MSEFSGKCDLCDTLEIFGDRITPDNTEIFVGDIGPLKFKDKTDLIPYYPFLEAMMSTSQDFTHIVLSKDSYIDREENEILQSHLDDVLKAYRKAKRKKETFDFAFVEKECHGFWIMKESKLIYQILTKRVQEKGDKATYEGLHLWVQNMYRENLFNLAKKHNLSCHPLIMNVARQIREFKSMKSELDNDD